MALETIDSSLGLKLCDVGDITEEQKTVITEREAARDAKDWAKSDKLRDELHAQGIALRDTAQKTIWYPL
jgi:cysteinyl-tRNA synthetase